MGTLSFFRGGGYHVGIWVLWLTDCHTGMPPVRSKTALRQNLAKAISWRMAVCMEHGIEANACIR